MGNLSFLLAAMAVTWLGIFGYMWTLRRSVQRLTGELELLRADDPPGAN